MSAPAVINKTSRVSKGEDRLRVYTDVYRVAPVDRPDAALAASGIPQQGDVHPENPAAFAMRIDAEHIEDLVDTYDVTVESDEFQGPQLGAFRPSASDIPMSSGGAVLKVWRLDKYGSTLKFPQNASNPGQTQQNDIGGDAVDNAGEPTDHPLKTIQLSLPVRFEKTLPLGLLEALRYTRNSRAFDVFASGTVLFTGWNIPRRPGRQSEVVGHLEFTVDPWLHLRQKVLLDGEGVPFGFGGEGTPGAEEGNYGRARYVVWHQPFPTTTDLSALLRYGDFG